MILKLLAILMLFVVAEKGYSQDPSFAQYFSSPLNINPALTGAIKDKWRFI